MTIFYINKLFLDVYTPQLPQNNAKAAVIVLAGGSSIDENGKPFQPSIDAIERLYTGVKLTKEHPSFSYLILSGDDPFNSISAAEVLNTSARVMDCHAKIILEDKSRNTDENLEYCAQIIKKLNVKNVIIVTSNYHIRRAINFAYLYMPANVKIYPYPSGGQKPANFTMHSVKMFMPTMHTFSNICVRFKEVVGLVLTYTS